MARSKRAPTICPHCGESVPAGRLACPECGSDANTGWQADEEIDYRSVEIPDTWPPPDPTTDGKPSIWWWVALLALAAFVLVFVFR